MYIIDANTGWNAGARSRQVCFDDCQCTFKVPATVAGVVVGLSTEDSNASFHEIRHALYFTRSMGNSVCYVYELGVQKNSATAYLATDLMSIRRVEGVVTYWKNGTLIYTSATPFTGPCLMDSSLYSAGDEIQ